MRELAEDENVHAIYKCQLYEMVRVICKSIKLLQERQEPEDAIQKGTYSAGWLAVRPDLDEGRMRRSDEAPWTEAYSLGSHRMMKSWVDKRFDHLTEDGKIRELSIQDLEKAGIRLQEALDSPELKKFVDASKEVGRVFTDQMQIEKACEISMEASSVSEPGGKVKLASWAGNPELEKGVDVPSFDLDLPEHKDAEQPYALVESVENLAPCVQVALMNKHLNMSNICPNLKISDQKLNKEAYAKKAQKARCRAKENAKQREAALEEFRHLGQDHSSRQIIEVIQALDTEDTQNPPPKYKKSFVGNLKKRLRIN